MAGRDGSGAPRERETERVNLCSGNQDSFCTAVLISPQAGKSRDVSVCVCADRESVFEEMSRWWAGVCPPTTTQCLHLHLGLFKPYVCVDFILHVWSRQVV